MSLAAGCRDSCNGLSAVGDLGCSRASALERSRLSHVFQNYVRPETLAAANAPLVARQAGLPLAQAWGGGLVAAVDGMRFVVPVPAAFARPNRKYFGSKRGMTWLNAMNDRGMGRGAKIVSGTVRDSLHMIDVIFGLDGGPLPEIVVTDTGSYSDVVFGLLELLGISYRPALADLADQKGWRIKADADYGPLSTFARGKIDTTKIRRNWEDILRVVASIYTGTVRAYDVVTMLQRDGRPTALGEAIAMYGRIFKSLLILSYIDTDETYRRDIKGIRNLQEGRHALARKICHGRKGELYHRYERGLENQLGALGLVLAGLAGCYEGGRFVDEVEHPVVVGHASGQRPFRRRVVVEEAWSSASGEGVDEQVQLVDQAVGDQGPHKCRAAADVDAPIDFTFDPAYKVGAVGAEDLGVLPGSCLQGGGDDVLGGVVHERGTGVLCGCPG
jgi:TnpA family transposase